MKRKRIRKKKNIFVEHLKSIGMAILRAAGIGLLETTKWGADLFKQITIKTAPILIALFVIFIGLSWIWDNKVDQSALKKFLLKDGNRLQEDQLARADVDYRDDSLTIQVEGEDPKRIVGLKKATFIQNKDGSYESKYRNWGLSLEPAMTVGFSEGLRMGLDLEWAYWRRYGALFGGTVLVKKSQISDVKGHIGLSYDLPSRWLNHSSFWVGGTMEKNPVPLIGVRLKFGGGL